jgi:RNA polymerase sigma-70 factor (sigma-E family)
MGQSGPLTDFGAFYERNYTSAMRVAYGIVGEKALADDVTQDAFAAAYRQRDRYRADGPPEAWLYRIVVNTAIGALRRQRVRWAEPLDPEAHDHPVDAIASMTDRAALSDALRRLDPRSRSAVVLRYYLDFDYERIAAILGTSESNVGSILSRSLDRLRAAMAPAPERPDVVSNAVVLAKEVSRHG